MPKVVITIEDVEVDDDLGVDAQAEFFPPLKKDDMEDLTYAQELGLRLVQFMKTNRDDGGRVVKATTTDSQGNERKF